MDKQADSWKMDINNKGKGFIRSKLTKAKIFLRVHSKPSMPVQYSSNKVSPSPYSQNGSNPLTQKMYSAQQPSSLPLQYGSSKVSSSLSYTPNCNHVDFSTNQSVQKLSTSDQLRSMQDNCGDENVDIMAATYISLVRERFKVEKVASEAW